MAKPITIEELKKENAKLKRLLAITANKLHESLNAMQPLVAESKDDSFIRIYEGGRNYLRRNFNLGTELKKKTKKDKKPSEDELYFNSLPCSEVAKTDTLFQMMRATYKEWIIERLNVQPIWEGREFAALKTMERYFLNIAIGRGKKHMETTGEVLTQEMVKNGANQAWNNLLTGLLSGKVSAFIMNQKKISQIQYNLTNIIDQLKNGPATAAANNPKNIRRQELEQAERELALANGVESIVS